MLAGGEAERAALAADGPAPGPAARRAAHRASLRASPRRHSWDILPAAWRPEGKEGCQTGKERTKLKSGRKYDKRLWERVLKLTNS